MRLTRKTYTMRREKIIDFAIGFVGWFAVNGVLWFVGGTRCSNNLCGNLLLVWLLLALPINLIALIVLAVSRKWMALGLLAAIAVNLAISLVLNLFWNTVCGVPFFFRDVGLNK